MQRVRSLDPESDVSVRQEPLHLGRNRQKGTSPGIDGCHLQVERPATSEIGWNPQVNLQELACEMIVKCRVVTTEATSNKYCSFLQF